MWSVFFRMIVTDGLSKTEDKSSVKSDYQKWQGHNIDKTVNGRFKIRKSINGKVVYFGTYDTFSEACVVRDRLIECGWDKSILLTEDDKINEYYGYIRRNGDYCYDVNRPKNNKKGLPRYMGTCRSIEEALYYRDIAESNDYIIGKPSEYDLITDNPYINEGLKYPVPERLTSKNRNKSNYGKGYVKEKGPNSYQVWYNKKYYGSYTTQEYAEYIRLKLNENNWDKNKLEKIKKDYPKYYTYILHFWRHIYLDEKNQTWYCKKLLENNELITFSYKNPYDTLHERDLYEKYNWNIDDLVELADYTENPYEKIVLPPYPTRRTKINYKLNEEYYTQLLEDMIFFIREFDINSIAAMEETLDTTEYTIKTCLDKFNINWSDFKTLVHSGEEPLDLLTYENIITPDLKPKNSKTDYIYYDKSRKYSPWIIRKNNIHYGSYSTKKIAIKVVNRLKKCDWNKNKIEDIKKEINYKTPSQKGETSKLIYTDKRNPKKTRYYIQYKNEWYGSYTNKKTAEKAVKLLKKYNWDKKRLKDIKKKLNGEK